MQYRVSQDDSINRYLKRDYESVEERPAFVPIYGAQIEKRTSQGKRRVKKKQVGQKQNIMQNSRIHQGKRICDIQPSH